MRAFGVYGCMGPSRGPRVGSDRPPTTGPPPHLSNPLASQKRPSKPIELSEREIQDARTGRRAGLGVGVGRLSWETRGRCGRSARVGKGASAAHGCWRCNARLIPSAPPQQASARTMRPAAAHRSANEFEGKPGRAGKPFFNSPSAPTLSVFSNRPGRSDRRCVDTLWRIQTPFRFCPIDLYHHPGTHWRSWAGRGAHERVVLVAKPHLPAQQDGRVRRWGLRMPRRYGSVFFR